MKTEYQLFCDQLKGKVKLVEPLARFTTFKIGGPADLFYEAKTTAELMHAISVAGRLNIPFFILGGGTNLLIADNGFRGLVIKNISAKIFLRGIKGTMGKGESSSKTVFVEADSGVAMNKLVRFTLDEGLSGLEMHLGLPGTVGGAVFMNSKWTNPLGYVGDAVYQAKIITKKNEIKIVPRDYFHFGYDQSILQKTWETVISVVFSLSQGDKNKLWKIANESIYYRKKTQPQGVSSPGCTFRNITKAEALSIPTPNNTTSAGFLIEHAGLKSIRVGGAQISEDHANFIINFDHAKASDVLQLIEIVKSKVKERFGVLLIEEIVKLGEF